MTPALLLFNEALFSLNSSFYLFNAAYNSLGRVSLKVLFIIALAAFSIGINQVDFDLLSIPFGLASITFMLPIALVVKEIFLRFHTNKLLISWYPIPYFNAYHHWYSRIFSKR